MKYYPRVLRYLRPYWRLAIVSAVLILFGSAATLLVPWPLKILFDNVLGGQPLPPPLDRFPGALVGDRTSLLIAAVVAALAVAVLQNTLPVIDNYVNARIEQSMILDFRGDLFRHAQRLSLSFHNESRAGGLIYAINYQADAAARLIMVIPPVAQALFTLIGMFWISLILAPQLALLSLIVVPFLYYSVGYYIKHIQTRLTEVRGMEGESLSIIHEAMSMLRVIVAFGREDHEYRRFREQGERAVGARVKLTVRQTLFSLAVNVTTAVGTALVLGFGAYLVLQRRLTPGELLIVMSYTAAIYNPLETISTTVGSLQEQFISLQLAFNLLDTEPEIRDAPGAVDAGRVRGHVAYEGVNFSYKGRVDTLKGVAFEARAGQVTAVVGPTGAGKTTLISLLPRFYDPQGGRILLDGRDTRALTVESLRRQISIVLQEPLLFAGTIGDNIRYGRLDATMEEIVQAARDANAHDFIMRLPDQYATALGERGAQLSGGERQRIAVARAFLKDAPILILDEPTSSIDSRTEAVILEALERLMEGRTTFMVAHRLSTIRSADTILVMHHGQLVEQGTHDELLLRDGLYKQLHDMQTRPARGRERLAVQAHAMVVAATAAAASPDGEPPDEAHDGRGDAPYPEGHLVPPHLETLVPGGATTLEHAANVGDDLAPAPPAVVTPARAPSRGPLRWRRGQHGGRALLLLAVLLPVAIGGALILAQQLGIAATTLGGIATSVPDVGPTQTIGAALAEIATVEATANAPTAVAPVPTAIHTAPGTPATATASVAGATVEPTAPIAPPPTATAQPTVIVATTPTATAPPPPPAFQPTDRIDSDLSVNLRSGPGTGYGSLGLLPTGTPLRATGESADAGGQLWRRFVLADGRQGWVRDLDVFPVR